MSGIVGTSSSKSKVVGRSQDTAKAWCNFNGTGTVAIRDSFNVSGLTDHSTGTYSVHWLASMGNTHYCTVASNQDYACSTATDQTGKDKTYQKFYVANNSTSLTDVALVNVVVLGD